MKLLSLFLSLFIVSMAFISCDDDDDQVIQKTDLPQVSQQFLDTHFPGIDTRLVEKDNDSYDVHLSNGFKVEFNHSGEWDDVDGGQQAIPQSILDLLPQSISSYVNEHYSGQSIIEVNKEAYGFEIELTNGLDLRFSANGEFTGIDT